MKKSTQTLLLGIILLAYAAYAARFIQMSLFTVDGQTYAALFDDAMISMTYARSLANGDGLVWYPGAERIEGFSNPLWVGFMALLHLLPIPQRLMGLPVMIAGGLFVLGCLFFIYKIANRLLLLGSVDQRTRIDGAIQTMFGFIEQSIVLSRRRFHCAAR